MGLPASQHRLLTEIESALRRADPRLASLFTIFSRLHSDDEMPAVEQLRAWMVRSASLMSLLRRWFIGRWFTALRKTRVPAALVYSFALATIVSAVLVSVFASPPLCPATTHLAAHQSRCIPVYPYYFGK